MGHSVSKAADNAVKKSEKVAGAARTPEQIIATVRAQLSQHLAVVPEDVRFLLAQYDAQAIVISDAPSTPIAGDGDCGSLT